MLGNVWVHTQHCGYWCSGAKAPDNQYPQFWLNIHYIAPVLYQGISFIVNIIREKDNI